MNAKLTILSAALALLIAFGSFHVFAQGWPQTQTQTQGRWQMVAGNGGDGGAAWKINVETGQSYFCYRQNCFPSTQ
jgi:hypothetical protein